MKFNIVAAVAAVSVLAMSNPCWAECIAAFENCGDNIDNDCDGATDEGCTACTGPNLSILVPYLFDTLQEVRKSTNAMTDYGNNLNHQWQFLPSHRMTAAAIFFESINLEATFDWFGFGTSEVTGDQAWGVQDVIPNSQALVPMFMESDGSVHESGIRTNYIAAACASGGGQYRLLSINAGVDGALLYPFDNATFEFVLPANREAFVTIDTALSDDSGKDFDLFVTDTAFHPTFFAYQADGPAQGRFFGQSFSETGEVVYIEPSSTQRTFHGNIVSWTGAGRFRLFIASPAAHWPDPIDTCIQRDAPVAWEVARVKQIAASATAWMLAATDGQFDMRRSFALADNMSFFEAELSCDIWFSEEDDAPTDCSPGTASPFLIEIRRPYWRGESSWTDDGQNCCNSGFCNATTSRVAETVVHEWGHLDAGLDDEYDSDGNDRCGVSLMAGSGRHDFLSGNNSWEFCTGESHGDEVQGFLSALPAGADNWADWDAIYSAVVAPPSPDFSQLQALREVMLQAQQTFVTFSGP